MVLAVATQGKRFSFYVKTYKLSFSNDGKTWTMYEEGGQVKVIGQSALLDLEVVSVKP